MKKRKVHRHETQFDAELHSWCGRGRVIVKSGEFEATPQYLRCKLCDRDWFPKGQPEWHYRAAIEGYFP